MEQKENIIVSKNSKHEKIMNDVTYAQVASRGIAKTEKYIPFTKIQRENAQNTSHNSNLSRL